MCDITLRVFTTFGETVTTFLVCIALIVIYCRCFKRRQTYQGLPPCVNFKLPILGHLHLLDTDIRTSFRRFRQKTGDVYSLYFGRNHVVVVSGLKALKTALIHGGDCLLDRPSLFLVNQITNNNGLVFTSGQKWKEHRQFTATAFKHLGMGRRTMNTLIQDETSKLIYSLRHRTGSAFDPSKDVSIYTTNIMTSILVGKRFDKDDESFMDLVYQLEENMNDGAIAGILNIFPVLSMFPGDIFKYKKLLANNRAIHSFIEDHLSQLPTTQDHFAGLYNDEMHRLSQEGIINTLSGEDLITTISDLLFAGADDMTTAIRWCLAALVAYPSAQTKIYQQIREEIGSDRMISLTDRSQLPTLEAFYLEVLRFCNISVPTLPRAASRDITLHGYHIPKGTMVMPDFDSVLMDTELWGDPGIFRPERHIGVDGNLKYHEGLTVFSLGKRDCVGRPLAKLELFIFLGTLIQKFEISSPDNLTIERVDGQFGLSHRPHPFKIKLEERTNSSKEGFRP